MAAARAVLIFDGECGFCSTAARWARRRLPPRARVEPWQRMTDLAEHGLTPGKAEAAAYWVDAHGGLHRGAAAVSQALRAMGGGWAAIGRLMELPGARALAGGAYEIVARNRHRLPGGTPECRPDPAPVHRARRPIRHA